MSTFTSISTSPQQSVPQVCSFQPDDFILGYLETGSFLSADDLTELDRALLEFSSSSQTSALSDIVPNVKLPPERAPGLDSNNLLSVFDNFPWDPSPDIDALTADPFGDYQNYFQNANFDIVGVASDSEDLTGFDHEQQLRILGQNYDLQALARSPKQNTSVASPARPRLNTKNSETRASTRRVSNASNGSQGLHRTEKRYRENINSRIEDLRKLTSLAFDEPGPGGGLDGAAKEGRGKRTGIVSKATVLENSIRYIKLLETRHTEKTQRIAFLKERVRASLEALSTSREVNMGPLVKNEVDPTAWLLQ